MIEIMIERWDNRDGTTDYVWSLWQDGKRAQIGNRHDSAEAAESEAIAFCRQALQVEPDRVSQL